MPVRFPLGAALGLLALAGAGCASSDSTPVGADSATVDCARDARRVTQTIDGRPQITIDQDRYQRCISERRQKEAPPQPQR